ncbi:MAG: insulinase family protein [Wenzhouxiangella sp.]|nr:insulinase family protein [Wenzhouxiangella sp.]TVR92232.1 MAG: insulinase family protein [Wenzhouxiangellaceae bacterium]
MTGSIRIVTLCLGLAWLLACSAVLANEPRLQYVTTVEGISEYRLDNGLRVLLMPDESRPTATINITYFVGSKHESYGETGMAHLLEHMLFYGTPDHQDIKAEISERGGVANGTTWFERTNYFQTLPSGEENLAWAIRMEADRMVNSLIDEDDLASEMTVVRNEFEIGENNPIGVLMQRVMATAYLWHGYGRSTIGARSDIENVPIERLQAFYRKYYQPDNAILILSGNFDSERALDLITEHFGAIPAPERSGDMILWPTYTREPVQDGERAVTVRRSGNVQATIAAYHIPAAAHEDFAAISVLAHLLGDMPSGRLHRHLVESELASQVGAFAMALPEPGVLLLLAQSPNDVDLDEVRAELLAAVDSLIEEPADEAAVRRSINALSNGLESMLNDSNRVGIQLSEWAAAGDWRLIFLHRDRVEAVTPEDVQRVAGQYLRRDNRTIGQFIPDSAPERAEIPEAPDLSELLAGFTGRDDRAAGEAFEPTPENIQARLVEFQLANGARVALLPKYTRGNRIRGQISMRMGNLDSLSGRGEVPLTTAAMLMRGSENYSRQEIRDRIDELQSSLGLSGTRMVSANIESRRQHVQGLLELLADILQQPAFPETELAELRRQRLTGIDQQRDEPGPVANRALGRHFNILDASHPDYVADWDELEARIRAVERDQLIEFHRSHYGFGPATTISFVGDFDADELRATLESLFGQWSSQTEYVRIDTDFAEIEPTRLLTQLDDKASATLIASSEFPMNQDHPDYPAMAMAGHLLGGGFLSSRLANRIRDDEGLSYSVGGGFNAHPIDEIGRFFGFAMFAPENLDRLEAVLAEELAKLVAEGVSEEELDAGRRGYLQQMSVQRSDDSQLAAILNTNLFLNRDIFHISQYEDQIRSLSADDINQALRRHFDPARVTISIAGDFEQ